MPFASRTKASPSVNYVGCCDSIDRHLLPHITLRSEWHRTLMYASYGISSTMPLLLRLPVISWAAWYTTLRQQSDVLSSIVSTVTDSNAIVPVSLDGGIRQGNSDMGRWGQSICCGGHRLAQNCMVRQYRSRIGVESTRGRPASTRGRPASTRGRPASTRAVLRQIRDCDE